MTYSPELVMPPPSSTGISRLSPAPDAAEPIWTVLPGNLVVTLASTPDSVAVLIVRETQTLNGILAYQNRSSCSRVWPDGC